MEQPHNTQKINGLTLRSAGADDADGLAALVVEAFREYEGILLPPSGAHKESRESISRRLSTGWAAIATVNGIDVGCIFCESHADGYLYFGRLSVLPRFRNRGIARALIDHVETHARVAGARGVRLGVRLQLEHLIGRYQRQGYRITKLLTHDGYVDPTYVYMEKVLDL
jgi:ribosomal protein S18 acetylase RimI-like enzyme